MAQFSEVEKKLLIAEGTTVSNNPQDYGGMTKFGISQRSYPHVDIATLTLSEALAIYEKDYWNFYRLDEIVSQKVADKLFISLINMNPHEAVECLQKAVNYCYGMQTVDEDGVCGEQTITAVNNSESWGWLHDRFAIELVLLYISKVEADKSQINFFVSWSRRAVAE